MDREPGLRIGTKATEDGPAFYPFGSWGGGYLVDDRAERWLATWHRWRIWVQTAVVMLFVPDFMPGARALRYTLGVIALTALIHGIVWFCVRDCRRTAVRLTAEESLRMEAEAGGHGQIGASAIVLVFITAMALWLGFFVDGPDRSPVLAMIWLASSGFTTVHLVRLGAMKRRLDRLPASRPGLWMRQR